MSEDSENRVAVLDSVSFLYDTGKKSVTKDPKVWKDLKSSFRAGYTEQYNKVKKSKLYH